MTGTPDLRAAQIRRVAVVTTGLALTLACSGSGNSNLVLDASSVDLSNSIDYRPLTRADFQASEVPPEFAHKADRVGALTCVQLLTTPDTWMTSAGLQTPAGERLFAVTFNALGFGALMNRDCSWWDDERTRIAPDYVLEHEQIHFAIHELGARRLNANAAQVAAELERKSAAATASAAIDLAREGLARVLLQQGALNEARDDALDAETSSRLNPERQKAWLAQVNAELVATAEWASKPRAYYRR